MADEPPPPLPQDQSGVVIIDHAVVEASNSGDAGNNSNMLGEVADAPDGGMVDIGGLGDAASTQWELELIYYQLLQN